jgi:hypothetical protein
LNDYGLRYKSDDYFIRTWKSNDHNHIGYLRVKYLANDYTSNETNWPYVREVIQAKKKTTEYTGGGAMGGTVYHTEYKEKPLPVIKVMAMQDEEDDIKDKEIIIVNIKDFDNL